MSVRPIHNMHNIHIFDIILCAGDPEDVLWLISQLAPGVLLESYTYDGYAHLSCLWALNARQWVSDKILQHLETVWS